MMPKNIVCCGSAQLPESAILNIKYIKNKLINNKTYDSLHACMQLATSLRHPDYDSIYCLVRAMIKVCIRFSFTINLIVHLWLPN